MRRTALKRTSSVYGDTWRSLDLAAALDVVAERYAISRNPADYVFVAVRANSADRPNENGDAFAKDELLRFDHHAGKRVYQTYELKPNHINHRASNPKAARGFVLDAAYNKLNSGDEFVEVLIAVDRTKDRIYAKGILDGTINKFSMGCSCAQTRCNVCAKVARTEGEFCTHIRRSKMRVFKDHGDGNWQLTNVTAREASKHPNHKLAFEWCEFVGYDEISGVDVPADPTALTQEVLSRSASLSAGDGVPSREEMERESQMLLVRSTMRGRRPKTAQAAVSPMGPKPEQPEMQAAGEQPDQPPPQPEQPAAPMQAADDAAPEFPEEPMTAAGEQPKAPAAPEQPMQAAPDGDIEEFQEEAEDDVTDQMSAGEMGIDPLRMSGSSKLTVAQVANHSPSIAAHMRSAGKTEITVDGYKARRAKLFRHAGKLKGYTVEATPEGNLCVACDGQPAYAVRVQGSMKTKAERRTAALTVLEAMAMHGVQKAMQHYKAFAFPRAAGAEEGGDTNGAPQPMPPASVTDGADDNVAANAGAPAASTQAGAGNDIVQPTAKAPNSATEGGTSTADAARMPAPSSATKAEQSDVEQKHKPKDVANATTSGGSDDRAARRKSAATVFAPDSGKQIPGDLEWTDGGSDSEHKDEERAFKYPGGGMENAKWDEGSGRWESIDLYASRQPTASPRKPVSLTAADREKAAQEERRTLQAKLERIYKGKLDKLAAERVKAAQDAFVERFKRGMRLAALRMAKNVEDHLLKEAMFETLAQPMDLGGDEQFPGMGDDSELMATLIEDGIGEHTAAFADKLCARALELSAMSDEALQSLEKDAEKLRIAPVVTPNQAPSPAPRRAALRDRARDGSLTTLNMTAGADAPAEGGTNSRFDRNQLRQAFAMSKVPQRLGQLST
jgi:hypothetical protein